MRAGTSLQSLVDAIDVCQARSATTTPPENASLAPLRCVKLDNTYQQASVSEYKSGQEYITISYSWPGTDWTRLGSSNETSTVVSNGGSTQSEHFSRFAADAVASWSKAARISNTEDLGIWIDHECINQSDKDEKDAQVAIMDSIYIGSRCTLILMEDVAITKDDYAFLVEKRARRDSEIPRLSSLVHDILKARWFKRAWCSQEVILSRRAQVFIHDSEDSNGLISFAYSVLAGWVVRAGMNDNSINPLREPRGLSLGTFAQTTVAWAFSTVSSMRCYNEYDKIVLVHNLVRAKIDSRIPDLPNTEGKVTEQDTLNVCKLINVWAVTHGDFSLLVSAHLFNSQLSVGNGFSWIPIPTTSDPISESWHASKYHVSDDRTLSLTTTGLKLRGIASKITHATTWQIWRDDDDKLFCSIDGQTKEIPTQWWSSGPLHTHTKLHILRDTLLALAHYNAENIYRSFIHPDEDHKLATPSLTPNPSEPSFKTDIESRFSRITTFTTNLADELRRSQTDGKTTLTLLHLENGETTVYGTAGSLDGKWLFQPHILRPNDWGDWLYTVNAMVLDRDPRVDAVQRCVGRVRCFQLLVNAEGPDVEVTLS